MSVSYVPMNHSGPTRAAGGGQRLFGARPRVAHAFSSLLHAAVVAAMLVVADKAMDSWTEGNLLIGWMVLWVLAFAGLALLAAPSRRAAASLRAAFKSQNERRMQAAQDEQYWQLALSDPRIMADIRRAMGESPLPARRNSLDYWYWLHCPTV